MTKEVEPSVKDDEKTVRGGLGPWRYDWLAEHHREGAAVHEAWKQHQALDRLVQQLQEAEERWNSHSCTQKLQGLELVQARSERDAAIERAEMEFARGVEAGRGDVRRAITQKDEQIEDVIAALARWVDNDPSVSPGENIRMLQDALAQQLSESEKEKDKAWKLLDLADAKLQGIAALLYPLNEGENEWQALRRIATKLAKSEKEQERLREALKRLRQEANKDWFNAPDSLCGVIQAITDQALSPDSQEKP